MVGVEDLRGDLENSLEKFLHCKDKIEKLLHSTTTPTLQVLEAEMEKFEQSLHGLNRSHTTWVTSEFSGVQLIADQYSAAWLENKWDQFVDLEAEVDSMISELSTTPAVLTNEARLDQYCKQMDFLKQNITRDVHELTLLVTGRSFSYHDYSRILSNVKNDLNIQFMELMDAILLYDSRNLEVRLNDLEQFRRNQMEKIFLVELGYAELGVDSASCSSVYVSVVSTSDNSADDKLLTYDSADVVVSTSADSADNTILASDDSADDKVSTSDDSADVVVLTSDDSADDKVWTSDDHGLLNIYTAGYVAVKDFC